MRLSKGVFLLVGSIVVAGYVLRWHLLAFRVPALGAVVIGSIVVVIVGGLTWFYVNSARRKKVARRKPRRQR
jgi:hypothetical protein